jgi:hypothetical protein
MTPEFPTRQSLARCLLRVAAILFIALGLFQLLANNLESYRDFDPSYLGYYFMSVCLRPILLIIWGLLLGALSRRLAKWAGSPAD